MEAIEVGKIFEDLFMDIQADMVFACMDYVKGSADKVYVYGSCEGGTIAADCFFEINGQIIPRHKTNVISNKYDVSIENQRVCIRALSNDVEELKELCKKHQRPMPTEIKMIYDVKKNSLDVGYKYDVVYSNHEIKGPYDIADEWFEEVKNSKQ